MQWRWLVIANVMLAPAVIAQPPSPISVIETKTSDRPNVIYAYSIINPRIHRVSVKAFDSATAVLNVPERIACNGVGITGGFSHNTGELLEPEGLVRTSSQKLSKLTNWPDGGVLSIASDAIRIVRIAAWRRAPTSEGMALQSRPILVFGGRVDEPLNDPRLWNRVAVGTMYDGNVVFIGAFNAENNAVTLRQFAQDAIKILGPKLELLLNLDGGPSAFFYSVRQRYFPSQGAVTTYLCGELL